MNWLWMAVLLAGCASDPKNPVESKNLNRWDASGQQALTLDIGLISDTQFHESRAYPSPVLQQSGDNFVPVTLRSAQQVIGADDILQRALKLAERLPLILHVGDALDVSCATEWQRFEGIMTQAKGLPGPGSWIYTPGNHDGFLAGNMHPPATGMVNIAQWDKLCDAGMGNAHRRFDKNDVIQAYSDLMQISLQPQKTTTGCSADKRHCWAIRKFDDKPWQSFIVQLVRMPESGPGAMPIYAILLDSSNYFERVNQAGSHGELLSQQLQAARSLMPDEGRYFLVAHHPPDFWITKKWTPADHADWEQLVNDARSLHFIITSHTHRGGLYDHGKRLGGLIELNTGSLADAPIYMRTIKFTQGAQGEIGVVSPAAIKLMSANDCKPHIPDRGQGPLDYSAKAQRNDLTRGDASKASAWGARAALSLWEAAHRDEEKHWELQFQLLAYADIAERTFPIDQPLPYRWTLSRDHTVYAFDPLTGRDMVVKRLREFASCRPSSEEHLCSLQAKENLLLALDRFYRETKPLEKAALMRLCMALDAADESPWDLTLGTLTKLRGQVDQQWSIQLSPRAGAH